MIPPDQDQITVNVRKRYAKAAAGNPKSCCEDSDAGRVSCCGDTIDVQTAAQQLGYTPDQLAKLPEGANLGLGCGNPTAIASLSPGETVLDLGSGAGIDCFLAADAVTESGRVIGVDMTPEMIDSGRRYAQESGYNNVEFRLGEIEHLPVADSEIDVIMSNCVINLSHDKGAVYREAFRVLRPGGRLAISDVVATGDVPDEIRNDPDLWSACAAGALSCDELESTLVEAGFSDIHIEPKEESREFIREWRKDRHVEDYFISSNIKAIKPEV